MTALSDWVAARHPVRTRLARPGVIEGSPAAEEDMVAGALAEARVQLWRDLWRDAELVGVFRERLPALRRAIDRKYRARALVILDELERLAARPMEGEPR